MARTVNVEAHADRRDTFVDAGLRLMQSKGYRLMSIQDVLDETESSKGAFYHYFDSKGALLEAMIDRITDTALATVEPAINEPNMTAVDKLVGLFSGIAGWKNARRDLLVALLEVWMSDDNIVVREKIRHSLGPRLGPLLTRIVAQGKGEGQFDVDDPASTATLILAMITASSEAASRLFLDCQSGQATIEDARKLIRTYQEAMERILAAPRGSLTYVDEETIQIWFG
jgi:AcrR family transcriptional regulator